MSIVQVPEDIRLVIDRQVAEGRASSDAEFVAEAVRRYAESLDSSEDDIVAAADEGLADMAAGRFETIEGRDDLKRLSIELWREIALDPGPG